MLKCGKKLKWAKLFIFSIITQLGILVIPESRASEVVSNLEAVKSDGAFE